ncbi:MAG TPA: hypothetical protein VJU84_01175 [Pyrinomonadaceae bacterium]|nr:hypothetical protein [Pyrinomonadaceae bacterium]
MQPLNTKRGALVVAHPGHELRVYGWLESTRPRVYVMTDGSGRTGHSRLGSTARILNDVDATTGAMFGRFTDQGVYQAILRHDCLFFTEIARELADEFVREGIDYAAGDAEEGYNTTHDICRLVLNAAVEMASAQRGKEIGNYDFFLMGRPAQCPDGQCDRAIWFQLDDATMNRKLTAANNYPELAAEVETAIKESGESAFRIECLRPVEGASERFATEEPYYESYGRQQVAAGHYEKIISYGEHIRPIAEALRDYVRGARR